MSRKWESCGFHACREFSKLGGQHRAAVFIKRFFVEHQPVDIGDFLAYSSA